MKYKILWLTGIALAYFLGYITPKLQHDGPLSQLQVKASALLSTQQPIISENLIETSFVESEQSTVDQYNANFSVLDITEKLSRVDSGTLSYLGDIEASARIFNLLKNIPNDEILTVLNSLTLDEKDRTNLLAFNYLVGRYAEQDALSALSYIEKLNLSRFTATSAKNTIYARWAKYAPEDAFQNYLNEALDSSSVAGLSAIRPLFKELAAHDVNAALDKIALMQQKGVSVNMAIDGISQNFSSSGQYEEFIHKLDLFDDGRLTHELVTNWTMHHPEQAAEWVSEQEASSTFGLAEQVLVVWGHSEFEKAADWYMSTAASSMEQQKALTRIVQSAGMGVNPQKALDWLNKQDELNIEQPVYTVLKNSVYQHPKFAEKNLELLSDVKLRDALAYKIYSSYRRVNKNAAKAFLENSPYKVAVEQQIERIEQFKLSHNKN